MRERTELLRRAADRIEERFEEFVTAEIADTGKPVIQARELDVARAIANFRAFADVVAAAGQESFLTELAGGRKALNYAVRKPLGVVAVVVPWNLPLLLLTWKIAPALACGNAVVVKPSEETPSTATLLAEVLAEVGLLYRGVQRRPRLRRRLHRSVPDNPPRDRRGDLHRVVRHRVAGHEGRRAAGAAGLL